MNSLRRPAEWRGYGESRLNESEVCNTPTCLMARCASTHFTRKLTRSARFEVGHFAKTPARSASEEMTYSERRAEVGSASLAPVEDAYLSNPVLLRQTVVHRAPGLDERMRFSPEGTSFDSHGREPVDRYQRMTVSPEGTTQTPQNEHMSSLLDKPRLLQTIRRLAAVASTCRHSVAATHPELMRNFKTDAPGWNSSICFAW